VLQHSSRHTHRNQALEEASHEKPKHSRRSRKAAVPACSRKTMAVFESLNRRHRNTLRELAE
jgi:hypothetical protein